MFYPACWGSLKHLSYVTTSAFPILIPRATSLISCKKACPCHPGDWVVTKGWYCNMTMTNEHSLTPDTPSLSLIMSTANSQIYIKICTQETLSIGADRGDARGSAVPAPGSSLGRSGTVHPCPSEWSEITTNRSPPPEKQARPGQSGRPGYYSAHARTQLVHILLIKMDSPDSSRAGDVGFSEGSFAPAASFTLSPLDTLGKQ